MLYYAPKEQIKTVCYNLSGVVPTPTAKELEMAIRQFIPDAKITYKPDPLVMEYYRTRAVTVIDDSRAREEWGWKPMYADYRKVIADFIQEMKTRPQFYGLPKPD